MMEKLKVSKELGNGRVAHVLLLGQPVPRGAS